MSEFQIIEGNALEVLAGMAAGSVQCCITSPPYWGMRDYKIEPVVVGGDAGCEHVWGNLIPLSVSSGLHRMPPNQTGGNKDYSQRADNQGSFCSHCSAWRGCLGLEPTPDCGRPRLRIRDGLDVNTKMEILRRMLSMRSDCWEEAVQGNVQQLLQGCLEGEAVSARSQVASEGVRSRLSETPRGGDSQDYAEESPIEMGGHREAWRLLRLLWGSDARISNSGSHKRRWLCPSKSADGEIAKQFDSGLPRHQEAGVSAGKIPGTVLQLQLLDGLLGILPSLNFHQTIVPADVRRWFEQDLCGSCYVCHIVLIFRQVKRVLRDDGTLWLNLGDSYANDRKWGGKIGEKNYTSDAGGSSRHKMATGLKGKDLVGIPWRVAFALQADGWWLRSDIIWSKSNPMPESVRDRPTKSHEYVFLLSKSERYYFDQEAVREASTGKNGSAANFARASKEADIPGQNHTQHRTDRKPTTDNGSRNIRSVWTIPTAPFPEAHFATFPPALVEPMVKAGCPLSGTVLDPFAGAGTTGLVACGLGRNFIGIEANPEYCEMMRRRIHGSSPLLIREAVGK